MTIAVDTSALMAIVLGERDALPFARALAANSGDACVSAATLVEATIVAEARQGSAAAQDLAAVLRETRIRTVPLDATQASIASAAWRRFGKGRHTAALNLGDCYSYALARHLGAPLLFKGDGFRQTDIAPVL
ncbi:MULTISPECIES: type II toxin-antitoxin system VapC family toxin [unclassified Microbacterium]|uniref:type II toxin-antitoxin system VapC family toxin n=1 Tax=unclassified Microbacterium TaxID=2609290 RepID=UPI00257D642D|nr:MULTISPECIES: type II toxin-antitoxin system VapC family toxin [unclassified Microbacterium]